jgi:hypothetical protein
VGNGQDGFLAEGRERLSLRGAAALALRCAQRVRPLLRLPADVSPEVRAWAIAVLDDCLRHGNTFARGLPLDQTEAGEAAGHAVTALGLAQQVARRGAQEVAAVHAAASAAAVGRTVDDALDGERYDDPEVRAARFATAHDYAREAAREAREAAQAAAGVEGCQLLELALAADFAALLLIDRASYGDLGMGLDPSEAGPLGPLWPGGVPAWCRRE